MRPKRTHAGFTLIELLTVIAILSLLIGILLPTLSRARSQAKANVCLSKLKMIGTSAVTYLNENRDYFFPVRLERLDLSKQEMYVNEHGAEAPRWQWFLTTDSGPVITKPLHLANERTFNDESLPDGLARQMTNDLFFCPELSGDAFERDIRDGAYGYNYQYLGNTRRDGASGAYDNFPVGNHSITSSAQTVWIADSRGAGPRHGTTSYMLDPPRLAKEKNAKRFGPGIEDSTDEMLQYSPAELRHVERANVLFVDSHAEAMNYKELGYEVDTEKQLPGVGRGGVIPISKPESQPMKDCTNRLWTGNGRDPFGVESQAGPTRGDGRGGGNDK